MFLMAAKEYHYNREDRHVVHKTYYQIMLSVTPLMEGYYNVVDQFLSTSSCKPCSAFGYMNRNEGETESRRIEQELAEPRQRMKALLEEMNEKHSEALTNHNVELATQYREEIERPEDLYSIM